MLEKFLNKKVAISYTTYHCVLGLKGIVTKIDDNFIELDNDTVVAIKYITTIKSL